MKPEEPIPNPPNIQRIDKDTNPGMEEELPPPVRPHFLVSNFNIETEQLRRKHLKHLWAAVIFGVIVAAAVLAFLYWIR